MLANPLPNLQSNNTNTGAQNRRSRWLGNESAGHAGSESAREREGHAHRQKERERERERERALEADSVQLFCASASVYKILRKYFTKCLFLLEYVSV
jgi:hypothetical protein